MDCCILDKLPIHILIFNMARNQKILIMFSYLLINDFLRLSIFERNRLQKRVKVRSTILSGNRWI